MASPLDELLEVNVPVDIAMDVLHSDVIEDVDPGGALHHLHGMSLGQQRGLLGRILFEAQIFNGRNERVGVRVLRACSAGSGTGRGADGKGAPLFFQARDGRAEPYLYGSQSLGAFKDVRRVFGPDVPVLRACILEKDGRARTWERVGSSSTDGGIHHRDGTEASLHATERAPR